MGHSAVTSATLVRSEDPGTPDLVVLDVVLGDAAGGDHVVVTCSLYQPPIDRNVPSLQFFGAGIATLAVPGYTVDDEALAPTPDWPPHVNVTVPVAPFTPGHPLSPDVEVLVVADVTYVDSGFVEATALFPEGFSGEVATVTVPLTRAAPLDHVAAKVVVYQYTPVADGTEVLIGSGLTGGQVRDLGGRAGVGAEVSVEKSYLTPALTPDPLVQQAVELTTLCNTVLEPAAAVGVTGPTWVNRTWVS